MYGNQSHIPCEPSTHSLLHLGVREFEEEEEEVELTRTDYRYDVYVSITLRHL